jgi:hypothetical protein
MRTHRFGRKLKLPSTVAIKHQLLMMMLEDEIRAIPASGRFKDSESPALAMLRRLRGAPTARVSLDQTKGDASEGQSAAERNEEVTRLSTTAECCVQ